MVIQVYPHYRDKTAINQLNPHLHNVPLQIAAERGVPAVAIWLWFIATVVTDLTRRFYAGDQRFFAAAGLAAVASMLAAGLFEYNFGDSEFLMLFLVIVTLPFAALRHDASPAPRKESTTQFNTIGIRIGILRWNLRAINWRRTSRSET